MERTEIIATSEEIESRRDRILSTAKELGTILPPHRILSDANQRYGMCTSGSSREIPLAIQVISREEIIAVLKVAQKHKLAVYPLSTGKNWGYGTANPVENACLLLDLSLMNKILDFDPELGTLRIEPGVTQSDLDIFLQKHGFDFLVPSTGAGPQTSLMGNLLERGYGITPHADHFGALLALEAILADGETYKSTLSDLGCAELNQNFKWGLGPYLDGLFAQSNLGVVVECTITLFKRPEAVEAFVFTIENETDVTKASTALRELAQRLPGILGGMNLMNGHRLLAMNAPYPSDEVASGNILSKNQVLSLREKYDIACWTGIGGIYGTVEVVRAAKKEIRRTLKPFAKKIRFANQRTHKILGWLANMTRNQKIKMTHHRVGQLLEVVSGRPTRAALPLAYWRTRKNYILGTDPDFVKDGCGLIWYSPLVINKPDEVARYIEFVNSTCSKHGIEPLITLTTVSERCFDSTVPLLFDRLNPAEVARARMCYEELLKEGQKIGFFPYRLGVDQMKQIVNRPDSVSWSIVASIKQALDPENILSPGRYCPARRR